MTTWTRDSRTVARSSDRVAVFFVGRPDPPPTLFAREESGEVRSGDLSTKCSSFFASSSGRGRVVCGRQRQSLVEREGRENSDTVRGARGCASDFEGKSRSRATPRRAGVRLELHGERKKGIHGAGARGGAPRHAPWGNENDEGMAGARGGVLRRVESADFVRELRNIRRRQSDRFSGCRFFVSEVVLLPKLSIPRGRKKARVSMDSERLRGLRRMTLHATRKP